MTNVIWMLGIMILMALALGIFTIIYDYKQAKKKK